VAVNKVGLGSLLLGAAVLLAIWFFGFAPSYPSAWSAFVALVSSAVVGGVILLGFFLALVGVLILVV